jgi:hypothetical protein
MKKLFALMKTGLILALIALVAAVTLASAQNGLPGVGTQMPGVGNQIPNGVCDEISSPNCTQFSGGQTVAPPPATNCPSTGVFNLGNVCNDIYFIGAMR